MAELCPSDAKLNALSGTSDPEQEVHYVTTGTVAPRSSSMILSVTFVAGPLVALTNESMLSTNSSSSSSSASSRPVIVKLVIVSSAFMTI